jgi:hypothetical protein
VVGGLPVIHTFPLKHPKRVEEMSLVLGFQFWLPQWHSTAVTRIMLKEQIQNNKLADIGVFQFTCFHSV